MGKFKDLFCGLLAFLTAALLAGCTSVRYVPLENVSHDSVYIDRRLRDSVYLHDSVFVNRWTQGDTVYVDKVVTRYKYKDRWRYDTISVLRTDSVQAPYPVAKDLSWWEKTRMHSFPILVAIVAVLAFIVVWLARKLKKK